MDRGAWWATVHGVAKTERLKSTSYIYKVSHDYFVHPKLTECFMRILSQLRNMNPMHFAF